jgi:hypothetical protein
MTKQAIEFIISQIRKQKLNSSIVLKAMLMVGIGGEASSSLPVKLTSAFRG